MYSSKKSSIFTLEISNEKMTQEEQLKQMQKLVIQLQQQVEKQEKTLSKKDAFIVSLEQQQLQVEKLNKELSEKDAFIISLEQQQQQLEKLSKVLLEKDARIANLESQLEYFRKQLFVKKSEKNLPVDPNVLIPGLFDDLLTEEEKANIAEATAKLDAEITQTITVTKNIKKREQHRTLDTSSLEIVELPEIVPENIDLDLYVVIEREITDKLIHIPAKIYIERTIRPRYVLKSHLQIQDPMKKAFEIAPLPASPLPKCIASSSILTEIIIQKFQYHLPFYRVIQKFKSLGLQISDSTVGDWYAATCSKLKLLYDLLKYQVLQSDYIQVDESTLRVIDNEKNRTIKGYIWVVRDAVTGITFFYYKNGSRSKQTAKILLGEYRGAIQSDGYNAYDQFENAVGKMPLGCMAHARRKFAEALSENKKIASEGLLFFSKLYGIEKDAKDKELTSEKIAALRQENAYPVLQLFEKWLIDNYNKVLNSSRIGKAISYTYTLLPRLSRYVLDGRYNIDNNLIESAIRPLAIGRNNWLFAGSTASATRTAMMYSFISSCKAANVEPHKWFAYAIENIASYQEQNLDLTNLLPNKWKPESTQSTN